MEAVQRQHKVKTFVRKGQLPHITLHKADIFYPPFFCLPPCTLHHVRGIVHAGDVCVWQCFIHRHTKHARPHRHLQYPAAKALRYTRKRKLQIMVVFPFIHVPYQLTDCLTWQRGAGYHPVIERRLPTEALICVFDFIMSAHFPHPPSFIQAPHPAPS